METDATGSATVNYALANSVNQYPGINGNPLTYDANGNLTAMQNTATPSSPISASYDAQNRLLSATRGTGGGADTMGVVYDQWNRPIYRTVNGVTTTFVWDGWNLSEEHAADGSLLRRYYHGAAVDEIIASQDMTNWLTDPNYPTIYYHHDALGSTIALTDATGALVESCVYDVFGKATVTDAATGQTAGSSFHGNRFLYTGREFIAEAGLYDYRNRVYSAELGRFLQTDPIRFAAGDVNLYRYVFNNCLSWIDPFGENVPKDAGNPGKWPDPNAGERDKIKDAVCPPEKPPPQSPPPGTINPPPGTIPINPPPHNPIPGTPGSPFWQPPPGKGPIKLP